MNLTDDKQQSNQIVLQAARILAVRHVHCVIAGADAAAALSSAALPLVWPWLLARMRSNSRSLDLFSKFNQLLERESSAHWHHSIDWDQSQIAMLSRIQLWN